MLPWGTYQCSGHYTVQRGSMISDCLAHSKPATLWSSREGRPTMDIHHCIVLARSYTCRRHGYFSAAAVLRARTARSSRSLALQLPPGHWKSQGHHLGCWQPLLAAQVTFIAKFLPLGVGCGKPGVGAAKVAGATAPEGDREIDEGSNMGHPNISYVMWTGYRWW